MSLSVFFRLKLIAGLCLALTAFEDSTSLSAQTLAISHAQGTTQVSSRPGKVLTFDLGALDTLDALGVSLSGVPKASLPPYLAKYEAGSYEKIGSLFEPDYEAVNVISPDLIIVGERSRAKYKDLTTIAPTIDLSIDQKDFLNGAIKNARLLGLIFGKEAEIEARISKLQKSIITVRQASSSVGRGLIVLTTGGKMSAYGPGSRFGIIHDAFGVAPAIEGLAASTHGQAISAELILQANPDWLFVLDRDTAVGQTGGAVKRVLDNELIAQTTAWKKGHIVYLDPANWYLIGSGIQSLQANVDEIARALTK